MWSHHVDNLLITVKVAIALPPLPYARRSAEVIASELAQAGVSVELQNLEWAQWLDRVFARHDFDMTIVAHVEPMDLGVYARDDYYFGYHSDAYKKIMARLDAAATEPERLAAIGDAQRLLSADAVNVWLFEYPALGVFRLDLDFHAVARPVDRLGGLGVDEERGVRDLDLARGGYHAA